MKTEPITISFLGVDERSKSAYQLFFESIKPVQFELIEDFREAQLCLIDKDSYNIQQYYEELIQNHPDIYTLVLSIIEQPCVHNKEFFLKKPIKREALLEMLKQICGFISGKKSIKSRTPTRSQIKKAVENISKKYAKKAADTIIETPVKPVKQIPQDEAVKDKKIVSINKAPKFSTSKAAKLLKINNEEDFVGNNADIDINIPEQLSNAFYSPDKLLQNTIMQACIKSQESEQIVQLNVMNHAFYFDAKEQKVHSSVGPAVIRPLCVVNINEHISYCIKPDSFRDSLNSIFQASGNNTSKKAMEKHSWSMPAFIWLITLWCSRGRVPEGMDLSQPVYLKQWPNLTRLKTIPHAIRIAALIYDQPQTLIETARQLGIKQRYVFAFFSACKSTGLSDISSRNIDRLFETEKPKQHKNKSILSKLLGRLVNISDNTTMKKMASSSEK